MRKAIALVIAVSFVLALCQKSKAEMIWSDGFESDDFSAWTSVTGNWDTSGGNVHSGSKRAQIFGPYSSDGDILLLAQSTEGYKNIKVEHWARVYESLESNDFLYIEWSPDGGANWNMQFVYAGGPTTDWQGFGFLCMPMESADDNPLFQLRIRSLLNNGSDVIYFDDIVLSGDPIPEPSSIITLAPFLFGLLLCRSKKIS